MLRIISTFVQKTGMFRLMYGCTHLVLFPQSFKRAPMRGGTLGKTTLIRTIRTCTDLQFVQAVDSMQVKPLLIYSANVARQIVVLNCK